MKKTDTSIKKSAIALCKLILVYRKLILPFFSITNLCGKMEKFIPKSPSCQVEMRGLTFKSHKNGLVQNDY